MKLIITEEQSEKLNHKVRFMVNKHSIEHAIELFDGREIIKRAYQDNPSSYLNQFNDLTPIEKDDRLFYIDKDRLILFYYNPNKKNGFIYINYNRIWKFFEEVIGLEDTEIQTIINNWLEETYNSRGLTPSLMVPSALSLLEETYKIKL